MTERSVDVVENGRRIRDERGVWVVGEGGMRRRDEREVWVGWRKGEGRFRMRD